MAFAQRLRKSPLAALGKEPSVGETCERIVTGLALESAHVLGIGSPLAQHTHGIPRGACGPIANRRHVQLGAQRHTVLAIEANGHCELPALAHGGAQPRHLLLTPAVHV